MCKFQTGTLACQLANLVCNKVLLVNIRCAGVDIASLLEIANIHVGSSSKKGRKGPGSRTSTQSAEEELEE